MHREQPRSWRRLTTVGNVLALALCFHLCFAAEAWAYIDPGAGSYVFQLLIAFIVGGLFVIKSYWQRLCAFFKRRSPDKQDDGNAT